MNNCFGEKLQKHRRQVEKDIKLAEQLQRGSIAGIFLRSKFLKFVSF